MADTFVSFDDLEDGLESSFGDELNARFTATKAAVNLALRFRTDVSGGNWSATAPYKLNDVVWLANSFWVALIAHTNSQPATGNANWRALGAAVSDASATTKGVVKLATAPTSAANPLAVGDNDPRLAPGAFSESVQDVLGTALVDSATIDATYNDAGNLETLDVKPGTVTPAPHLHTSADVSDFQDAARGALEYATGAPVQTLADLRAVAAARRQDKQQRLVEDAGVTYRFDLQGTGADDGAGIIAPADGAAGRWFKSSASASSTGNADTLGGQNGGYYLNRANHTGTQAASTITGLATVATSGTFGDLTGKPAAFGGSGANHKAGLVPDPGVTAGTTRFLREDGSFATPPSGGAPLAPAWSLEWNNTGGVAAFDASGLSFPFNTQLTFADGDLRLDSTSGVWNALAWNTTARLRTELYVATARTISVNVLAYDAARVYLTPQGGTRAQAGADTTFSASTGVVNCPLALAVGWNTLEVDFACDADNGTGQLLRVLGNNGTLASLVDAIRAPLAVAVPVAAAPSSSVTDGTANFTTSPLAYNAQSSGALAVKSAFLRYFSDVRPCRWRFYASAADRTNDLNRAATTQGAGVPGLLAEFVLSASTLSVDCGPLPLLSNNDAPRTSAIYYQAQCLDPNGGALSPTLLLTVFQT